MPNFIENYNNTQLNLVSDGTETYSFNADLGDYVRISVMSRNGNFTGNQFFSNKNINGVPEVNIYQYGEEIAIKPNEVLEQNYVSSGNYTLQVDFLRNIFKSFNDGVDAPDTSYEYEGGQFLVKEISTSRKEVRLTARNFNQIVNMDDTGNAGDFQDIIKSSMGTLDTLDNYTDYSFDWVLTAKDISENIPIVNYTFDNISHDTTTLIIRLNKPLSINITNLSNVNIEKEVITTQEQEIKYISNVKTVTIGSGLTPDLDSWEGTHNTTFTDYEQNYESIITSSFDEFNLDTIIHNQNNDDINLNIDFNEFSNHVFFGSAASKLSNFKDKVGRIEGHLADISSSLQLTQSNYVDSKRKDLFDKIQTIKIPLLHMKDFYMVITS